MATSIASLKNQLNKDPENHAVKQQVVELLARMKNSSQLNPLDKFLLAQFYSPTSPQYKKMMREAATAGCSNAMLSMCELLLKTNSATDLRTAVYYINRINRSNDSFVQKQSKELVQDHPELALEMRRIQTESANKICFFPSKQEDNQVCNSKSPMSRF
jgi:hypothetical protein